MECDDKLIGNKNEIKNQMDGFYFYYLSEKEHHEKNDRTPNQHR